MNGGITHEKGFSIAFCHVSDDVLCSWARLELRHKPALFREGVINGIPYATGGVGVKERELMEDLAKTKDFNLKVVLASISGSYLSDLMVYIEDMSGKMVFETVTDGPWLYVDLPLGKHTK